MTRSPSRGFRRGFGSLRSGQARRWVLAITTSVVLAATTLIPLATEASAADLSTFSAGDIVGDEVFFDTTTMTAAQVQAFIQSKEPTCTAGYTCLKDYSTSSRTLPGDQMCNAYVGSGSERASTIIYRVAQACGINPRVILVMLQKEQGLVTSSAPTAAMYQMATGYNCPTTSGCDAAYYGLFNQIYGTAWLFKRYANPAGTSQFYTWYAPGKTWNILYSPDSSCGTSPVFIANQATADLYYYTPYQPDPASLAAGYGKGDACSSYGIRNFFAFFTDWFGATHYSSFTSAPDPTVAGSPSAGEELVASAGAWSQSPTLAFQWLRAGVAVPGATSSTYDVTTADAGSTLQVRVTASRTNFFTTIRTSAGQVAVGYPVTRLAGADRYATAVAVSQAAHPGPVDTVYLATGVSYPDALSVTSLVAHTGAGLLLVPPSSMPADVAAELVRLEPRHILLIGGESALDAGTEARVTSALASESQRVDVTRIAGADRFDTSRLIAARFGSHTPTAYLATGTAFPDALSAAAVAGASGAPVILVNGSAPTIDGPTADTLSGLGARSIIIAGGTSAVSEGVEDALRASGFDVTRYAGADRYATNAALVDSVAVRDGAAFVATGTGFADALTGSAAAGARGSALFLTSPTCSAPAVGDYLMSGSGRSVVLVGGDAVLSDDVALLRRC
jgi:putative cell wall-binding protein